jgi:hypothetical protein
MVALTPQVKGLEPLKEGEPQELLAVSERMGEFAAKLACME